MAVTPDIIYILVFNSVIDLSILDNRLSNRSRRLLARSNSLTTSRLYSAQPFVPPWFVSQGSFTNVYLPPVLARLILLRDFLPIVRLAPAVLLVLCGTTFDFLPFFFGMIYFLPFFI